MYVNTVLPAKMKYNLYAIEHFSFWGDIGTMFKTVFAVLGKQYPEIDFNDKEAEEKKQEVSAND